MSDFERICAAVFHLRNKLSAVPPPEPHKILRILRKLDDLPITVQVLQETGIGKVVNKLRKQGGETADAVKQLIQSWKELVREAMEAEEEMSQNSPGASPEDASDDDEEDNDSEREEEESDEGQNMSSEDHEDSDVDRNSVASSDRSFDQASPPVSPPARKKTDKRSKKPPVSESKHKTSAKYASHDKKRNLSELRSESKLEHEKEKLTKSKSHSNVSNDTERAEVKRPREEKLEGKDKDRTSLKRAHESSPSRGSESLSKKSKNEPESQSQARKKKTESGTPELMPSPQKKSRLEDDAFSQAMFKSPLQSPKLSKSPSKSPVQKKLKESSGSKSMPSSKDKRDGNSLAKSSATKSSSYEKEQLHKRENSDNRTSRPVDDKFLNGNLNQSNKNSDSKLKSNDKSDVKSQSPDKSSLSKSSSSTKSSSSHTKKPFSQSSVSSHPKSSGSNTEMKSSSSSSSTKSTPSSTSASSSVPKKSNPPSEKSKSSPDSQKDKDRAIVEKPKSKPLKSSVDDTKTSSGGRVSSSASNGKLKSTNLTKLSGSSGLGPDSGDKKRRRLSSGHSTDDDAQSFQSTGKSFADCLAAPMQKTKKIVKKAPSNSADGVKKLDKSSSSKASSSQTSKVSKGSGLKEGSAKSSQSSSNRSKGSDDKYGSSATMTPEKKKQPKEPQEIVLNLPEISTDYKPLRLPELSPKKRMSSYGEEGSYIGSKNTKTKVFSGRAKTTYTSVPSLYDVCMRTLLDNIDALDEIGVPYDIIKPVLEKCTPQQLLRIEDYNPYLIEDTDHLWQIHADKDFKKFKPGDMESWRELYLRKLDEREEKFKKITSNISASMAKKDPGRLTKMAFVNGPAKPPRNIQRKQAKHGTAIITVKPETNPHKPYAPSKHAVDNIPSSSSSVSRSGGAAPGEGGRSANPSYSSISVSHSNGGTSTRKPAKTVGPLMQRALKMKKMFRKR